MEHNDMVKKLCEKADISEEIAKDALMRAEWDMLEALIILEREGKIKPLTASMTTIEDSKGYEEVKRTAYSKNREHVNKFFEKLCELLEKSIAYSFVVERRGEVILSLPVLIMLIIAFSLFHLTIISAQIGLFLDCKYSVQKRK